LYRFLDWILELPEDLKQAFRSELAQYEQEKAMPYVTSNEQMAKIEGKVEEKTELAIKMLQEGATTEFVTKVTGFTIEQLKKLQTQSLSN
jgi:predicted transposase/invertase (TIGR01784 family)